MMFRSSIFMYISYNYVDIVIYQKINWSFAENIHNNKNASNCLWPFFLTDFGAQKHVKIRKKKSLMKFPQKK